MPDWLWWWLLLNKKQKTYSQTFQQRWARKEKRASSSQVVPGAPFGNLGPKARNEFSCTLSLLYDIFSIYITRILYLHKGTMWAVSNPWWSGSALRTIPSVKESIKIQKRFSWLLLISMPVMIIIANFIKLKKVDGVIVDWNVVGCFLFFFISGRRSKLFLVCCQFAPVFHFWVTYGWRPCSSSHSGVDASVMTCACIPYLLFNSEIFIFVLWLNRIFPNLPVWPQDLWLPAIQEDGAVWRDGLSELRPDRGRGKGRRRGSF